MRVRGFICFLDPWEMDRQVKSNAYHTKSMYPAANGNLTTQGDSKGVSRKDLSPFVVAKGVEHQHAAATVWFDLAAALATTRLSTSTTP